MTILYQELLERQVTKKTPLSRPIVVGDFWKRVPVYGEKVRGNLPLVTNAKSSALLFSQNPISKGLALKSADTLLEHVDEKTGEYTSYVKGKSGFLVESLDYDRTITDRYTSLNGARTLMPHSRTAKCNRLSCGCDISVLKHIEFNKTAYSGLQTCGSVWACPVCSAKVSERRKNEVVQALESHLASAGQLYFITFTFRHSRNDDLAELKAKFRDALKFLRESKGYKKYKKMVGYSGLIRALEVTWGQSNGWHPHTHEIVLADKKVSFQSIKRLLFPEWVKACEKAGLAAPSFRRGIDVQGGEKAGAYITKYGNELAKSHTKKARGDRYTPFDLLRSYSFDSNELHGAKFVEFAKGMQGARQLYWTNGLKDRFGINDKSDEALAKENQENMFVLGKIKLEKWRSVVKYNAVASVLIMSRSHEFDNIIAFVDGLYSKYVSSGDKQADDERIAKNRERYRAKVIKPEHQDYLTKTDTRDVFEKLNDRIEESKSWARSSSPEVDSFVRELKAKLSKEEQQYDFFNEQYLKKALKQRTRSSCTAGQCEKAKKGSFKINVGEQI